MTKVQLARLTVIAALVLMALRPAHACTAFSRETGFGCWNEETGKIESEVRFAKTPTPYTEGVRDYYDGTCYRARPYDDGAKADLWERGFRDAQRRDHNRVDRSHCRGTSR
jgi:hypothetical protein